MQGQWGLGLENLRCKSPPLSFPLFKTELTSSTHSQSLPIHLPTPPPQKDAKDSSTTCAYMHTDTRCCIRTYKLASDRCVQVHAHAHGQGGPGVPSVVGSEHHPGLADRVHPQLSPRRTLTWPCANCRYCDASWSDQGYLKSPHCLPLLPDNKMPPGERTGQKADRTSHLPPSRHDNN